MDTQSSVPQRSETGADAASLDTTTAAFGQQNRRAEGDRRTEDRRRSARGLFELRARRDRVVSDRRRMKRRADSRFRLFFWRRSSAP